jgi:hypothetical protein
MYSNVMEAKLTKGDHKRNLRLHHTVSHKKGRGLVKGAPASTPGGPGRSAQGPCPSKPPRPTTHMLSPPRVPANSCPKPARRPPRCHQSSAASISAPDTSMPGKGMPSRSSMRREPSPSLHGARARREGADLVNARGPGGGGRQGVPTRTLSRRAAAQNGVSTHTPPYPAPPRAAAGLAGRSR